MDMMVKLEENEKNDDDYDGIFVVQNIHMSVSKAWATHVRNVKSVLNRNKNSENNCNRNNCNTPLFAYKKRKCVQDFWRCNCRKIFFVVEVSAVTEDVFIVFPNLMYFTLIKEQNSYFNDILQHRNTFFILNVISFSRKYAFCWRCLYIGTLFFTVNYLLLLKV